jgi:hypothetical protein
MYIALHVKYPLLFKDFNEIWIFSTACQNILKYKILELSYFPAHKKHHDFFVRNFRKNDDECILILVNCWKKTGLLHTKISNNNMMPDLMIWKQISLSHDKDV